MSVLQITVPISDIARRCFANIEANRYIGTGMTHAQLLDANVQMEVAVLLQHRPDLLNNIQTTIAAIEPALSLPNPPAQQQKS